MIRDLKQELNMAFDCRELLTAFSIFDPRNIPSARPDREYYGLNELQVLSDFYGTDKQDKYTLHRTGEPLVNTVSALIDPSVLKQEYQEFKQEMYRLKAEYAARILAEAAKLQENTIKQTQEKSGKLEQRGNYGPSLLLHDLYRLQRNNVYPQCHKLLVLACLIPVGTASDERSISLLNDIKTELRSRLKNDTLENLMRIAIHKRELTDFEWNKVIAIFRDGWSPSCRFLI